MTAAHILPSDPTALKLTPVNVPRSAAPQPIARAVAQAMKDPTRLVAHLRGEQLQALSYADYGTILCVQALSRERDDDHEHRLSISAVAYGSYASQKGDVLYHPNGYAYTVNDPHSEHPFFTAKKTEGVRSVHVMIAKTPVDIADKVFFAEREQVRAMMQTARPHGWGELTPGEHPEQMTYSVIQAYAVYSPDPKAAHALLSHPQARIAKWCARIAQSEREARRLAEMKLKLCQDDSRVTIESACFVGQQRLI